MDGWRCCRAAALPRESESGWVRARPWAAAVTEEMARPALAGYQDQRTFSLITITPPHPPSPPSIIHDSSPTARASALAEALAQAGGGIKVRTHQKKAKQGSVVDPDTLEPLAAEGGASPRGGWRGEEKREGGGGGGSSQQQQQQQQQQQHQQHQQQQGMISRQETMTMMVDSGLDVGLTLDLLKHAGAARVVVVVSARPELAESLAHVRAGEEDEEEGEESNCIGGGSGSSSSGSGNAEPPPAVYLCALKKEVAGTALEGWLKQLPPSPLASKAASAPALALTLDRVLASAAEVLWMRGRQNRRTAGLCGQGAQCAWLKGTTGAGGGANGNGSGNGNGSCSPRPFTALKLSHLCQYLHPCGQGAVCAATGPLHRLAFIHGGGGMTAAAQWQQQQQQQQFFSGGRTLTPPPLSGGAHLLASSSSSAAAAAAARPHGPPPTMPAMPVPRLVSRRGRARCCRSWSWSGCSGCSGPRRGRRRRRSTLRCPP